MTTIILRTASNYMLPVLLVFSVFVLLRGHYLPGGGFVGGLIASSAFVLHAFANGLNKTKTLLRLHQGFLMPLGLAVSFFSGMVPIIFTGEPFLTGTWYPGTLPVIGGLGTALFFDLGVYLVVLGVTLTIIFTISESS